MAIDISTPGINSRATMSVMPTAFGFWWNMFDWLESTFFESFLFKIIDCQFISIVKNAVGMADMVTLEFIPEKNDR